MDASPPAPLPFYTMPEGRQIARITCHRCGYAAELDPAVLHGLRLFRAFKCSRCGAHDADVSIRREAPEARPVSSRKS